MVRHRFIEHHSSGGLCTQILEYNSIDGRMGRSAALEW